MTKVITLQNHNTRFNYGGEIELEDFNTTQPSRKRIDNQVRAQNHRQETEKMKRKKDEEKMYQHYTMRELREMRLISNTDGSPTSFLTDEKWQKEFELRKRFVKPVPKGITRFGGRYSKECPLRSENSIAAYRGTTNWQYYCAYINDVLSVIRLGQIDYCYKIYQIMDLLRFYPKTLRTEYCKDKSGVGYWKVWLERECWNGR